MIKIWLILGFIGFVYFIIRDYIMTETFNITHLITAAVCILAGPLFFGWAIWDLITINDEKTP
jgi:hypothetical protein